MVVVLRLFAVLCLVALVAAQTAQDLELMEAYADPARPFAPRTRELSDADYGEFFSGLAALMHSRPSLSFPHVGVGYNANLDLVADWRPTLEHFGLTTPPLPKGASVDHQNIASLREFAETFQYSFENGIALERMITDPERCAALATFISDAPGTKKIIGGNAANMMLTFKREGLTMLPGFTPGAELKALFAQHGITFASPTTGADLYHIILEFKKGDTWGALTTPRANRFIFHCDDVNTKVPGLEAFHATMEHGERADLIVIAGLHLLERETDDFYKQRLATLQTKLRESIPKEIPVHLELASVGNPAFMRLLFTEVALYVNSLGFNEQELLSLYAAAFPNDPQLSDFREQMKDPSVELCLTMMKKLFFEIVRLNPDAGMTHRVGRMHLHTLKFHVVAETAFGGWVEGIRSVAAGAFISSRQSCGLENNRDPELSTKFDLPLLKNETLWGTNLDSFMTNTPVHQRWFLTRPQRPLINFWIAPVMVCKKPVATVGLGDAISSMGLVYHAFDHAKYATKAPEYAHLF